MSSHTRLRGIIFDLDGTLVDSKLDFEKMRSDIGVPPGQGILEHIDALPTAADRTEAHAILRKHEMAGAHAATLIPGVNELLEKIAHLGLKKAVFTRNDAAPTRLVIERFFQGQFTSVITREDAPAKPDPTGLLRICDSWHCGPDHTIYVGDYLFDLEAAERAQMKSILYLGGEPPGVSDPVYATRANYVARDFTHLHENLIQVLSENLGFIVYD
ncbi:MAG: HAD family hydrolase [Bdellovibrionota bacterium]